MCFLVALDKLLKDHGNPNAGIHLTDTLHMASMEYADDAVLPDKDAASATNRLTNFDTKANEEAGMKISIAKTKVQHIRKRPQSQKQQKQTWLTFLQENNSNMNATNVA